MQTAGVDLATEAAKTALAVLRWDESEATVLQARLGATDADVVAATETAAVTGIDCPFGWPDAFIRFVSAHQHGRLEVDTVPDWRRPLALRATDLAVVERLGMRPLSVSTDRIGLTAMRNALLLDALADLVGPVNRAGAGPVVEVYPAASLHCWGLAHKGYKGADNAAALSASVDALLSAAPWLHLGEHESAVRRSDDVFDAVVAALTARAAALELVTAPPPHLREQAQREGWIVLPTSDLAALTTCAH